MEKPKSAVNTRTKDDSISVLTSADHPSFFANEPSSKASILANSNSSHHSLAHQTTTSVLSDDELDAPSTGTLSTAPPPSIQVPKITLDRPASPKVPSVDDYTASFNFIIDNLVGQFRLSGIIVVAVFGTWLGGQLFGFLNFPFCVLMCILLSYVWKKELRVYKDRIRHEIERENGLKFLERNSESAEWFNQMFARIWIIFEPVLSEIIVSSVNPILEYYTPTFLDSISFSEFTLGTTSPRMTSFRAAPHTADDVIRFDFDFVFQPKTSDSLSSHKGERNSKIVLSTRVGRGVMAVNVPVLVQEMAMETTISVQLKTMPGYPYIKLLHLTFPDMPKIDYVLKPLNGLDIMDLPGLNNFLQKLTKDIIGWLFVSPNVFTFDLDAFMNGGYFNVESAVGVLMIRVCEAKGLKNVETVGESDPYTAIKIGGKQIAKTRYIENNLNPYWNETFYVLINSLNDSLELQVMDKDILKDRPLGSFKAPLRDFNLENVGHIDEIWKPLRVSRDEEKLKTKGDIRFELRYYPVPKGPDFAPSNSGILRITIHQAKELDESKSMVGLYNPFMEVYHNDIIVHKTKIKKRTNTPQWEDLFQILVRDVRSEKLKFILRDQRDLAADPEIGDFEILVSEIIQMLKSTGPKIDWWSVRNAASGRVRLSFNFTPVQFDHELPPLSAGGKIFMPPAIGVIRVRIVEAKGLKNFETVGVSDPYVQTIYLGQSRGKTAVVPQSLDPLWNEIFYLLVQDSNLKGLVTFDLFDFNQMQKDKFMGSAVFDLKRLTPAILNNNMIKDAWIPVTFQEKPAGQLRVELSYHPILKDTAKEEIIEKTKELTPNSTIENTDKGAKADHLDVGNSSEGLETISENKEDHTISKKNIDINIPQITHDKPTEEKKLSELYGCGIFRLQILETEFDENALAFDNYSGKKKPSPYIEVYDVSQSICSNETASLANVPKEIGVRILTVPGRSRKESKDSKALIAQLSNSSIKGDDKSVNDCNLIFRSSVQKKTYSSNFNETLEIFAKDVENGRLWFIVKDHDTKVAETKGTGGDDVKVEKSEKHPVLGKVDIYIKDLLDSYELQKQKEDQSEITWCKLFSMNPKVTSSVGKFHLKVTFEPIILDETILELEQDLETTESGKMKIELIEAKNLPAVDTSGTSDPYCNFKLNGEKVYKSKIQKKNNMHPIWNEKFEFQIRKRSKARLAVECLDYNQFQDNKLLGRLIFDCSLIKLEEEILETYDLMDDNGKVVIGDDGQKSSITLRYFFSPDETAETKRKRRRRHLHKAKDTAKQSINSAIGGALGLTTSVGMSAKKLISKIRKESSRHSINEGSKEDVLKDFRGNLVVHIQEAKNLKTLDNGSPPDPYLKIRHTDKATKKETVLYKTRSMKKTSNPIWNEVAVIPFEIDTSLPDDIVFTFSIKEHALLPLGGVNLGEYHLDVREFLKKYNFLISQTEAFEIELFTIPGDLHTNGSEILHLMLEFVPHGIPMKDYPRMKNSNSSHSISSKA